MTKEKKAITENFETSINELEQIVTRMDSPELSLEEALTLFERGISLSRECQTMLKKAQQKVTLLIEKEGKLTEESFLADDE